MTSIEDLKILSEVFNKGCNAKVDALPSLEKVLNLYEGYFTAPDTFFNDSKIESYFLESFSADIIQCLATLTSTKYTPMITRLLKILIDLLIQELTKGKYSLLSVIRPLFDPDSLLYKYCLSDLKTGAYQYLPQIDPVWRAELKVGDKIDALKVERVEGDKLEGWAIATIVNVKEDLLTCTFDGMDQVKEEVFHRSANDISPLGSRTGDWSWRNNLSTDDVIDVLDTQGKWYLSTVLNVNKTKTTRMLDIGFRVYLPNGTKIDSDGRKHEGWSSQYDTCIPAYSIRIQRPNLIAKLGTVYCRRALDEEGPVPNDSSDILKNCPIKGDNLYLIHRRNWCYSSLYLELMNYFANKGGFDYIMTTTKSTSSVECLFSCLDLMAAPYQLYHRLFVIAKITPFLKIVMDYMPHIPEEQLRRVKKRSLEDVLLRIEELMQRVFTAKTRNELLIELRIKVSISLLGADQLERRIQAIKLIAEACRSAKASQDGYIQNNLPIANDSAVLSSLLKVPQLIEEIFGKRSHIELIQRSTEILKFVLSFSKITKEDFNVIWECCVHDEQSKVEIFKVISDSSHLLPAELIGFIIEKFLSLPKAAFKDQDVEIICELSGGYSHLNDTIMNQILGLMWRIIKDGANNLSTETFDKVMNRFCDTITTPSKVSKDVMDEFFEKCYRMIESGENSIFALKILRKSMMQLPSIGIQISRYDILFNLLTTKNIFNTFFIDLERYYKAARIKNHKGTLKLQQHKEEVTERKEFLLFVVRYTKYKLTKENLNVLWANMVREAITSEDQSTFYSLLKQLILYKIEDHISSMTDLTDFFSSVICDESNNFQELPMEGVQVIEGLLLLVNMTLGNIVGLESVRKRYHGIYSNLEDENNFCVKILPTQIVGVSVFWKIILEAKSDPVSMKAIELINKIYTKLSKELEGRIGEISSNFIEIAMEKLHLCYQTNGQGHSNEIVKILRLIEGMLDDSERKGNGGITPLGCLTKGRALTLKIQNLATNIMTSPNAPKRFDLVVHSMTTYWQLMMLIAKRIGLPAELLRLIVFTKDIKERDNGKPLEALGIHDEDFIKVKKRNEEFVPRITLMENKKFTERANQVFKEVFGQFSVDGKMSRENCADFTRTCLGDESIRADNHQIKEIFKEYDKENKGYLIFDNFLHFYEQSANDKENIVWNNLKELGYGPDLNTLDMTKQVVNTSSIVYNKLPRHILSNNPEYLSFLFSLDKLGGEVMDVARNLIFKLVPSERHLVKLKEFLAREVVDWNEIFSTTNYCESIYYLYLLHTLIGDGSEKDLAEIRHEPTSEERIEVRKNVLKHKGIQWAINSIKSLKDLNNNPGEIAYSRMANYLIGVYIVGSLTVNGKLPKEIPQYTLKLIKEENKQTGDVFMHNMIKQNQYRLIKMEHISPLNEGFLASYHDLCGLLAGELGLNLLNSVDLVDLTIDVTGILEQLVSFVQTSNDKQKFISDAIVMIEALLIFKPEIYEPLSQRYDFSQIYLKEISNQDPKFPRDDTQQLIYFLSMNVCPNNLPPEKTPLVQILSFFLDDKVLLNSNSASNSLYELLPLLIDQYSKLKVTGISEADKFNQIIDYLQTYSSTEISQSTPVDSFLLGLLRIAYKLLSMDNSYGCFDTIKSIELIRKVFNGCLFPNEKGEYRCRTEKTRELAYNIVITLAKYDVNCWIYLIKDCMLPIREKVPELDSWLDSNSSYERSNLGYIGLKNIGCICYINSMLQQFFIISPFRNAILTVCDGIPPSLTKEGIDDNLLHQFQRTFVYLLNSNRRDFNPNAFCYAFKELDGKPTNTAIQHDAHEFLNILFERLERGFKDTPYKKLIQNIFGGKSCSQVICSNCGYTSATYEDYYTLSLEIKNQRNLHDSLQRFIADSTVSGYRCNNCEKQVDAAKRTLISSLPNVLIVHLQRFTYNFDTFMNEKIHTRLEFPNSLDMVKYTEEGYATHIEDKDSKQIRRVSHDNEIPLRRSSEMDDQEEKEKESKDVMKNKERQEKKILKDKDYYYYKLVGVVMHSGNADAGHYYSYINTNRGKIENVTSTDKDKWLEFNDSFILPFAFEGLETECFGGSLEDTAMGYLDETSEMARLIGGRSKSAYMLIYERNKKGMLPLKVDSISIMEPSIILNSLECDSTAVSRAEKSAVNIFARDSDDLYMLYKYHDVPYSIPSPIIIEVEKDNEVHLYEKLIYEKGFTDFLRNSYTSATSVYNYELSTELKIELRSLLCIFVEKFIFEIEAHTTLSPVSFPVYMYKDIYELFLADSIQGKNLIAKFVADPKRFFNLLLKCPEQQIRKILSMALFGAFTGIYKDKSEKLVIEFIDSLIGFIGNDVAVQWKRFNEFFELLRDVIMSINEDLLKYYIERDLIGVLLDFFLEKDSPILQQRGKRNEMGYLAQYPDFTPLMETVTFLVIHLDIPIFPTEKITPPTKQGTLSIILPELSMKCLGCKNLLPKYLKSDSKLQAIIMMMLHLAYRNKKFSQCICKQVLKGINSYDCTKVLQYLDVFFQVLTIEDEYSHLRMELLLGFSQPISRVGYGLSEVTDIEDEINMYVSPAETEERNKPLLQFLWDDRRRSENITTLFLKNLFTLSKTNLRLYTYLRDMPPPCYLYTYYMDWVDKFLDAYYRGVSNLTTEQIKEKDNLVIHVKELYKEFYKRVIEDKVQPPQLYMVGKITCNNKLDDKTIVIGNIKMTVVEVITEVYESKPMSNYNAGLSGNYLINHFNHIRNNANIRFEPKENSNEMIDLEEDKCVVDNKPRTQLKEEEVRNMEDTMPVKVEDKSIRIKQIQMKNNLFEVEERLKLHSGASNLIKNIFARASGINMRSIDYEDKLAVNAKLDSDGNAQSDLHKEDNLISRKEIIKESDELDKQNTFYQSNKDIDESIEPMKEIKLPLDNITYYNPLTEDNKGPKIIVTQPYGNQSEKLLYQTAEAGPEFVARSEPKYRILGIFHKINIVNSEYDKAIVTFSIKPKPGSVPNFYCPVSKCKCIATRYDSTVFTAQINDLSKPIGDYDIILKVKNADSSKLKLNLNEQSSSVQAQINAPEPSNANISVETGTKACPKCTFDNFAAADNCTICDYEFPKQHT